MGSGHNAYVESKEALKLISNLSSYHFSHKTVLKLLEDIYDLRCEYDSYATLDLLNINTASMKLNLYKLGSTTTYIYHSYNLIAYENKALPLKLDDINSAYEIEFFKDDMIFLLSDGITDNLNADELFILINPEYSTDEQMNVIIDFVKNKQGNNLADDLSMIIIKIK
ncbi:MAG: SpoIIE family protein phosphatase [Acholeplasmatales bacterium]|nr:SpoIIE family protein phosphatase [Acholeplasmatales bacterium]